VFSLYVNATIPVGYPYVNVSLQLDPLSIPLSTTSNNIIFLQVFSSSGQFDNASLYDQSANFAGNLNYNNKTPATIQDGLIIPYSNKYSIFDEDSVAIRFLNSSNEPTPVVDYQHWYQNSTFDGLSWIGMAYKIPQKCGRKTLTAYLFRNLPN
jgi:hypothetical protein